MEPREIIQVAPADDVAGCNGGGGTLGHPLVYLRFDGKSSVDCYYCSRRFVKLGQPSGATENTSG